MRWCRDLSRALVVYLVGFCLVLVRMRKLLEFLVRKKHWFLFVLLEALALLLIARGNAYQRNVFFSSANIVVAHVSSLTSALRSYMDLKLANKELLEDNGRLELRVLELQDQLEALAADTSAFEGAVPDTLEVDEPFPYSFILAEVVNNSVNQISNYITINKGRVDGIRQDMGVVSNKGIVGIVSTVSDHFAVVIPLLNPKSHLSCKIQNSDYFGSLGWNGRDTRYASLDELPRHTAYNEGDTVVTSGYSSVFPKGIMVGTIASEEASGDEDFRSFKILLSTDFATLKMVRVISNFYQDEQIALEREARKNDK